MSSALIIQLKNSESLCRVTYSKLYRHTQNLLESIAAIQNPPTDLMVSKKMYCLAKEAL
jgi:hypothetical protein